MIRRPLFVLVLIFGLALLAGPGFAQSDTSPDEVGSTGAEDGGPVVVGDVKGPLEERAVDFLEATVRSSDVQLVILQLNNPGLASGDAGPLLQAIAESDVPVAAWVGPAGATAFGLVGQLLDAVDIAGAAQGAKVGYLQQPIAGGPVIDGTPWDGEPYGRSAVIIEDEDSAPDLVDVVTPTIGQFIVALDGRTVGDVTLETGKTITSEAGVEVTVPSVFVRFEKPSLTTRFLRLGIRPDAAFFFLVAGLALVAFEFYAAGVGITAAVAAVSLLLAGFGLASLPMNWLAVVATLLGLLAYNWDFQRSELGIRSVVGTVLLVYGGMAFTDAAPQFGPRWWVVLIVVAGVGLFYMFAMTTIVRSRYSTPTIGREHLIGRHGVAASSFDPEGVVDVDGARWRARSHRAAGVVAGDPVEVIGVEGIVLEVGRIERES